MAGLSQRFRDAGFCQPKYMLDLHGRTLFAHSVLSFEHYFNSDEFLFVARDEADTPAFVAREAAELGIAKFRIAVLSGPTRGQAETVSLGLRQAASHDDEPLLIFNIDTFRPGFRLPDAPWMAKADGYLEVMHGDDPGFSYARADPTSTDQRVLETVEKRVISNLASTGVYYFARARLFDDAFRAQSAGPGESELYVAPLYNDLIARGGRVHYQLVAEKDVLFCGTPPQYADQLSHPERFGKTAPDRAES